MDHFDNENLDFMNDMGSSNLPEGFAWEDVSEGIYAKQKRKRKLLPFNWWLGLCLALIAVPLIWLSLDTAQSEISPVQEIKVQQEILPLKALEYNRPKEIIAANDSASGLAMQSAVENEINNRKRKTAKFISKVEKSGTLNANKTIDQNIQTQEVENINTNNSINVVENKTDNKSSTNSVRSMEKVYISNNVKSIVIKPLPLSSLTLFYNDNGALQNFANVIEPHRSDKNDSKVVDKSWSLNSFAGVNVWTSKYEQNNILARDRNYATKQLLGLTASFSAEKMLNKHFFIGFETSYMTCNNEFESSATRNVDVELKNIVIKQNRDMITGNITAETRGNVIASGTQYRYVKYYNKFSAFRLGAVFGYRLFSSNNLNLDIKVSSGYTMIAKQEGKTHIDDLDILDYNNNSPIFKNAGISLQPAIRLNYVLTDILSVGLQVSHERFLGNWSAENLDLSLSRTDLGATISYTF